MRSQGQRRTFHALRSLWLVLSLLALGLSEALAADAVDLSIQKAQSWLQAQLKPDGSFLSEPRSTLHQAQAELAQAFRTQGLAPPESVLNALSLGAASGLTEDVARSSWVFGGESPAPWLQSLKQGQGADGGFAAHAESQSSMLDSALTLRTLPRAFDDEATRALAYLLSSQAANGSWNSPPLSPLYLTATSLLSLREWAAVKPQAAAAAAKAASFLLAQRSPEGLWSAADWLNAWVYLSVHDFNTAPAVQARVRTHLVAAQAIDGSWGQDPFATALAIQALALSKQAPFNPSQSVLKLQLVDSESNAAVSGARIRLLGTVPASSSSDPRGHIEIRELASGSYGLLISHDAYADVSVQLQLLPGQVSDLGALRLARKKAGDAASTSLSGTVVDASTLTPIAGASIAWADGSASTLSDAGGQYKFDSVARGNLTLVVSKQGYISTAASLNTMAGGAHLFSPQLRPSTASSGSEAMGCRMFGRVTRASDAAPLAGALIRLSGANNQSASSDAAGNYLIPQLVSGLTTVQVSRAGFDPATATATLACAGAPGFELSPSLHLSGTAPPASNLASVTFSVRDVDTGLPMAGVAVQGRPQDQAPLNSLSGADGRVSIEGLQQTSLLLRLSFTGYDDVLATVKIDALRPIELGSLQMRKSRAAIIRGTVFDASTSLPLAGAKIQVAGSALMASSDSAGRYLIAGLSAGSQVVTVSLDGYASASASVALQAHGEALFSPSLSPIASVPGPGVQSCRLFGKLLRFSGGAPVQGASVRISGASNQQVLSDSNGRYEINDLSSGLASVSVEAQGHDTVTAGLGFACTAGAAIEFSPLLYETGSSPPDANSAGMSFQVIDAATDRPLPGLSVVVSPLGQGPRQVLTDASGRFTVKGLKEATVQLELSPPGFDPVSLSYWVTPLRSQDLGQLRLRRQGSDAELSDLAVNRVQRHTAVTEVQTLALTGSLRVQISNMGRAGSPERVGLLAFHDRNGNGHYDKELDTVLGRSELAAGLAAGTSTEIEVSVSGHLPFRDAPIHVLIDPDLQVPEVRRSNNTKSTAQAAELRPAIGSFNPVLKWHWDGATSIYPDYNQVMMAPVAGRILDTNGDGKIDAADRSSVVFTAFNRAGGTWTTDGVIRVVDGHTGVEQLSIKDSERPISAVGNLALADLDGDGRPEIIAVSQDYRVSVYRNDGSRWWSSLPVSSGGGNAPWGGVSVADLDGDGSPEILYGRSVFAAHGQLKWQASGGNVGSTVSQNSQFSFPLAADLMGTGQQNLVLGASVYTAQGSLLWQGMDGFAALADFDGDGVASIALVSSGNLSLYSRTGQRRWTVPLPGGGLGGPPTIADVDGDGVPDIGVAASGAFTVFRKDGSVIWSKISQDFSSQMTGSTVFDFDGDGSAELLYADELRLRAFKGSTGQVLWEIPNSSGTAHEYPLVLDIDADSHADLLVVSNDYSRPANATELMHGVRAFQDRGNSWVNTRQLWNQHAYSITNVNDDLSIPALPRSSWTAHNSFRANKRLDGAATEVPDLTGSYLRVDDRGAAGTSSLTVRVGNGGALSAPAGVAVAVYALGESSPRLLGVGRTSQALDSGQFEDLQLALPGSLTTLERLRVVVDDDGQGHQCCSDFDRSNNEVSLSLPGLTNAMTLSLSSDKPSYGPEDTVLLSARAGNTGSFAKRARVRASILTQDGTLVANLPLSELAEVPVQDGRSFELAWSVADAQPGGYRARAELQDSTGRVLDRAELEFSVQASPVSSLNAVLRSDKRRYARGELIQLRSRVSNASAHTDWQGLIVRTEVRKSGVAQWQRSETVAQLGVRMQREFSYALTDVALPVGEHEAWLRVSDSSGLELASSTVKLTVQDVAQTGVGLSGQLQLQTEPVELGSSIALALTAFNREASPLVDLPLKLRLVDPANGSLRAEFGFTAQLAAQGSYASSIDWLSRGEPGKLLAVLSASINGREQLLDQRGLELVPPQVRLSIAQTLSSWQKVLVLSACRRAVDDVLGQCGAKPLPAEDAAALARCDSQRNTALARYLEAQGLEHKITSTALEFSRELRSGLFSNYWVNEGAGGLREPLPSELKAALARGQGLVLEGLRLSTPQSLHACAGVSVQGAFANPTQTLSFAEQLFPAGVFTVSSQTVPLKAGPAAVVQARLGNADGVVSAQSTGGKTLALGFDWQATLLSQQADARWPGVLKKAFQHLRPAAPERASHLAGEVIQLSSVLRNELAPLKAQLLMTLPEGIQWLQSSHSPALELVNGRQRLRWQLDLAAQAEQTVDTRLRVLPGRSVLDVESEILVQKNGQYQPYQSKTLRIQVTELVDLIQEIKSGLTESGTPEPEQQALRQQVQTQLLRIEALLGASQYSSALTAALYVQARLPGLAASAGVTDSMARLVGAIAWLQHSAQETP